jgi:aryl-alcohol dehydrogenase-like predicted oxidoreductase/NAD-dependent dihydropyrimidine dehydrogenase PreA subunit
MESVSLGRSGVEVTRLCFGTLVVSPIQLNLPTEQAAALIRYALQRGITFLDTAVGYYNHDQVAAGKRGFEGKVVIATKIYRTGYDEAWMDIENSLRELEVGCIDILHLHAARDLQPFETRAGALRALLEAKRRGLVRAVGVSTHSVGVVRAAAERDEIDIVFPIINRAGLGIVDGTPQQMLAAIDQAHAAGKGIYAMKALAGGNLADEREQALDFVAKQGGIDCCAVGMSSEAEVDFNIAFFEDRLDDQHRARTPVRNKKLIILSFCKGCGECVAACPNGALSLVEGRSVIDHDRCLLCGYCSPVCPQFAIRMVG